MDDFKGLPSSSLQVSVFHDLMQRAQTPLLDTAATTSRHQQPGYWKPSQILQPKCFLATVLTALSDVVVEEVKDT